MIDLSEIIGFYWDEGNSRKNSKHGVSTAESEQVFFNAPLLLLADVKHSQAGPRFHALGKTHQDRFNIPIYPYTHIRVISARDMHKKERNIYEQAS